MPSPGAIIQGRSDYVVIKEIGRGGVGVVFLVEAQGSGAEFAAKILSPHRFEIDKKIAERFRRELRIGQSFEHRNLTKILDVATFNGMLVSITTLAKGGSLYDRLSESRSTGQEIPLISAIDWCWQILQGLSELHERQIVHRDLTPKNILFDTTDRLVVADFGVARDPSDLTITTAADQIGSLLYISPQQREKPQHASEAEDIFSAGQIFYEIFSGHLPHGNPKPISELPGDRPRTMSKAIERMRAYNRNERPQNATEARRLFAESVLKDKLFYEQQIPVPLSLLVFALNDDELLGLAIERLLTLGYLHAQTFTSKRGASRFPILESELSSDDDPAYLGEYWGLEQSAGVKEVLALANIVYAALPIQRQQTLCAKMFKHTESKSTDSTRLWAGEYRVALLRPSEVWIGPVRCLMDSGIESLNILAPSIDLRQLRTNNDNLMSVGKDLAQLSLASSGTPAHLLLQSPPAGGAFVYETADTKEMIQSYWGKKIALHEYRRLAAPYTSQASGQETSERAIKEFLALSETEISLNKWVTTDRSIYSQMIKKCAAAYADIAKWEAIEENIGSG